MRRCRRTEVAYFRYCRSLASLTAFLLVALALSLTFIHSCVHDRQRPRELIGFTDNSRFLSRFKYEDMAEFSVCLL